MSEFSQGVVGQTEVRPFRVCLHSADPALDGLCQRATVAGAPIEYTWTDWNSWAVEADLHLWDCEGPGARDARCALSGEHLWILRPEHLEEFHRQHPGEAQALLLRPVTSDTLNQALERCRARAAGASTDPRRAERDDLLGFLLMAGLRLQDQNARALNFLTRALHDFRTALMAAEGYCGLLIDGSTGPLGAEQSATLRRVQMALRRLLRLAGSTFQLSLGHTERERPCLEPGDITERVQQAILELTPIARSRAIEIVPDLQPCPEFLFDGNLIEQAVLGLLENAYRFSPRHSVVEIHGRFVHRDFARLPLQAADSRWYRPLTENGKLNAYQLAIRDQGTRIPDHRLAVLFDHDLGPGGSQDRSGQGLGLATCKMNITAHRGELTAESSERGVELSFVLPLLRPDETRMPAMAARA